MAWTDEQKQEAIDAYTAANPTEENSMEIVAEIAEDMGQSVNGVRIILSRAGVYIKKSSPSNAKTTGTRVSKADAQDKLKGAIESLGAEVDDDIIDKLTGKAANYLADIILNSQSD